MLNKEEDVTRHLIKIKGNAITVQKPKAIVLVDKKRYQVVKQKPREIVLVDKRRYSITVQSPKKLEW